MDTIWTTAGIYLIQNEINNKKYVGSSRDISKRKSNHVKRLNENIHDNAHLQLAWNKYGEENFTFRVLEYVYDIHGMVEREQYWIDKYECLDNNKGYNLTNAVPYRRPDGFAEQYRSKKFKLKSDRKKPVLKLEKKRKRRESILISERDAHDIKIRINNGESLVSIAKIYNINENRVSQIKYGEIFDNVLPELTQIKNTTRAKPLNSDQVDQIKRMLDNEFNDSDIAKTINCNLSVVYKIRLGYAYITDKKQAKLTDEQVITIRAHLKEGKSVKEISNMMGIRPGTIQKIKDNQAYRGIKI
nr:GIY-YIG nuclease family protein [Mycobacterium sp. E3298]